jgi:hypothetical protein
MHYLERSVDPEQIVGDDAVIKFQFTDLARQKNWWLVVQDGKCDLCIKDPGRDVDVFFTTTVRAMTDVWMGDRTFKEAIKSGDLNMQGARAMTRNVASWLKFSVFVDSPRPPLTHKKTRPVSGPR